MINILHIEKSTFSMKALERIANNLGHVVYTAEDEDSIFEILEDTSIDLIITSTSISEGIIIELRESEYEDIPILVLTSSDDIHTRKKLFNIGISDYIIKNQMTEEKLKLYLDSFNKAQGLDLNGRHLEIAVLDDSHLSLKVIKRIFNNTTFTNIDYYSNYQDLLDAKKGYTLYLIDLVLPGASGEEVMLQLRKNNPHSVMILMSSVTNFKTISNLLLMGADDFIMKPFDRNFFIARISVHLRTRFLMDDLNKSNEALSKMANCDGLTGLYNHRYIVEKLKAEYDVAKRHNHSLSVVMIDIDFFKKVNDTYGHLVGDEVLIEVSDLLTNYLRNTDIIGRYGGEEFLIVLPKTNLEEAYKTINHVKNIIEQNNFPSINHTLTISGGICEYDGQEISSMIATADANLYKAKNTGRNKIC